LATGLATAALKPGLSGFLLPSVLGQFDGNNAGGYRDDAVAQYHNDTGNDLPELGLRGNVSVAYRGQRDDGPINAHRNAGETVLGAFHQIHQCPDDNDRVDHSEQKDRDFVTTGEQRAGQHRTFFDEVRELENAKYAQQP